MNTIKNAMPFIYYLGTEDLSGRTVPVVNEARPVHLPFIWTYGRKGKAIPFVGAGKGLIDMLGEETFDPKGPYYSHGTALLEQMNEQANVCQVLRLIPADAKTSTLQLCLELVAQDVPTYQRMADGHYELDSNGDKVPTGTTIPGFVGRWIVRAIPEGNEVGATPTSVGELTGPNAEASTVYPIHDLKVSSEGVHGDGIGISLYPSYTTSTTPVDDEQVLENQAWIYNLEMYERKTPKSQPVLTPAGVTGARTMKIAYKEGAINSRVDQDYFVDDVVMPSLRDLDDFSAGVPMYGPLDEFHTYHENIETISRLVFASELGLTDFGTTDVDDGMYMVNLLQFKSLDGVPYHSVLLQGMLDGAAEMSAISTHYCRGGADGTMTRESYDADVAHQLENFGKLGFNYALIARYPFSCLYDTGFEMATKKKFGRVLGIRPNVHLGLSTHTVGKPRLTPDEESSAAAALKASVRAYPESTYFGTSACRAVIWGQSGKLVNSRYKEYVPGIFELAIKRAKYMGAGSGKFKSRYSYTGETMKRVEYMKDLNNMETPYEVRNKDWDKGLNWFQYYDTKRSMMAAEKTVYDDDTSVLTSGINMQIMCELNTVAFLVWRDLVGDDRLSKGQIVERSNEKIVQYSEFRFDDRVQIRPRTYYSAADEARGFSWSTEIHMYANNMPTVNTAHVITHRLEDLLA